MSVLTLTPSSRIFDLNNLHIENQEVVPPADSVPPCWWDVSFGFQVVTKAFFHHIWSRISHSVSMASDDVMLVHITWIVSDMEKQPLELTQLLWAQFNWQLMYVQFFPLERMCLWLFVWLDEENVTQLLAVHHNKLEFSQRGRIMYCCYHLEAPPPKLITTTKASSVAVPLVSRQSPDKPTVTYWNFAVRLGRWAIWLSGYIIVTFSYKCRR